MGLHTLRRAGDEEFVRPDRYVMREWQEAAVVIH